jgi:hypothetical protein
MYNTKFSSLLLVGEATEKYFFEKYFSTIELFKKSYINHLYLPTQSVNT